MTSERKSKGGSKGAVGALLQRWIDAMAAALGAALLPELITLSAEYLGVGLRFGTQLTSKRIGIVDADDDGFGREILCRELADWDRSLEQRSEGGWYAALSDTALEEVAGGPRGRVSWRVFPLSADEMVVGVAFADTALAAPLYGADRRAYGLFVSNAVDWSLVHDGRRSGAPTAVPCMFVPTISLTADLATETLHFRAEYVVAPPRGSGRGRGRGSGAAASVPPTAPKTAHAEWSVGVPQLATTHAFVSIGLGACARLLSDSEPEPERV